MMVPDHRAGTHLRCPRCGADLVAPGKPVKSAQPLQIEQPPPPSSEVPDVLPPVPVLHEVAAPPVTPSGTKSPDREVASFRPVITSNVKRTRSRELIEEPPLPLLAPNLPAPAKPPLTGQPLVPDRDKQAAVFQLGLVVGTLALFSMSPALWEWFAVWQNPDAPPVPPWVFALLLGGVIQLAYAVYLAQVPDWSALWTTTAALLCASAGYALMLGTTLVGREEGALVVLFRYADKIPGNRAAMWCFVMLCFTSVVTYFLGLTAARWHRSYRLLRRVYEA
jgi:hypothetical protein